MTEFRTHTNNRFVIKNGKARLRLQQAHTRIAFLRMLQSSHESDQFESFKCRVGLQKHIVKRKPSVAMIKQLKTKRMEECMGRMANPIAKMEVEETKRIYAFALNSQNIEDPSQCLIESDDEFAD